MCAMEELSVIIITTSSATYVQNTFAFPLCLCNMYLSPTSGVQRWSNRTRVLVLEYEYFLSTRTRVRRKVIVLVLEYITKVIALTITSHDYIFFI